MDYKQNDAYAELKDIWSKQAQLAGSIEQLCESTTWHDDSPQRAEKLTEIAGLAENLKRLHELADRLTRRVRNTQLPDELETIRNQTAESLVAAIDAIRATEQRASGLREELLSQLVDANRTQGMLRAYFRR